MVNANIDGGSPSATGELDSEIAALTSPNSTSGSRQFGAASSKGLASSGKLTPYDRSPTPQPPDSVIYPEPKRSFTCPVYKTARRGADPAGYVMSCELAASGKPDNWVLRGTALMCEGDVR